MDRRLGRPLPHQLPNPTRADPPPINLSPKGRMRYYSPFPVAIPQKRARSHALLTRPPLTPKGALDLHVLSLPPAFVLSQDQTLKLKTDLSVILDVRTSAHPRLRRRSPLRSGTTNNTPTRQGQGTIKSHLSDVHRLQRERSPYKTVKLTPVIGPTRNPTGVDMQTYVRRKQTKPPTYLFRYISCQRARDKTNRVRRIHLARPASSASMCLSASQPVGPSSAPPRHVCRVGEGVFTDSCGESQEVFSEKRNFRGNANRFALAALHSP